MRHKLPVTSCQTVKLQTNNRQTILAEALATRKPIDFGGLHFSWLLFCGEMCYPRPYTSPSILLSIRIVSTVPLPDFGTSLLRLDL